MSDGRRFLGGAAVGLFLAVAIVTAVNLGMGSVGSATGPITAKTAITSEMTTSSGPLPSITSQGSGYANANLAANATSSTTSTQSSSSPPTLSQTDNSRHGVSTPSGITLASLIQTLPAVAIALVLGIAVYQFSIRRVETG